MNGLIWTVIYFTYVLTREFDKEVLLKVNICELLSSFVHWPLKDTRVFPVKIILKMAELSPVSTVLIVITCK